MGDKMFKLLIECSKEISELNINFTDGTSVTSMKPTKKKSKKSKKRKKDKRPNTFTEPDNLVDKVTKTKTSSKPSKTKTSSKPRKSKVKRPDLRDVLLPNDYIEDEITEPVYKGPQVKKPEIILPEREAKVASELQSFEL